MEPNFVCEFSLTEKLLEDRFRKYNSLRCTVMLLIGIVGFVMIVRNGIQDMILHGFSSYWLFLIFCACAILLYGIFWPRLSAKSMLRRYQKEMGTDRYRVCFGDSIEVQEGSIRVTWDYSEITQVVCWKYTMELQKSNKIAIMLNPQGFVNGSFEEFKAFLREKRPDLTIPES